MHADEFAFTTGASDYLKPGTEERRYDPLSFGTWAEARKAYPATSLIRIVDLAAGTHFITPVFPQDNWSDLKLDGRTFVAGWIDANGNELPDSELADVLRVYDAGPDISRR